MAAMEHPGLLSWANSVRLTMASDAGRQDFKDQVQTIGFLFLDDYLDNIVSGAKQDPLIELVKTPGRKKASKKPKLKPSKLGNVISLEESIESENIAPVHDFHRALLGVKPDNQKSAGVLKSKSSNIGHNPFAKPTRAALQSIQPAENGLPQPVEEPIAPPPQLTATVVSTLALPIGASEHNDLSIIAEDEEPLEKKRSSTSTRQTSPLVLSESPVAVVSLSPAVEETSHNSPARRAEAYEVISVPAVEETSRKSLESKANMSRESNLHSISSNDTFHSISLDTPAETQEARMEESVPPPEPVPELEPEFDAVADMSIDEETGLLPEEEQDFVGPAPVEDTQMFDIDNTASSLPRASEKPSFPSLPEPMPLRKSIRAPREPSLNPVMLGAATPGGPGKRTSWLAKAREVKLLEVTSKRSHPPVPTLPPLTSNFATTLLGTKRKSSEMLAGTSAPQEEEHERHSKVLKIIEGETASRKSKETEKPKVHEVPPSPAARAADPNVSQEGVLNMLKKTVEGLGGKTGRSMGRSVGGGAASALAEAKAAAEARLAERDRKEDEVTRAMGLPSTSNSGTPPDAAPSTGQSEEHRLSVSDLFPMEGRVKEKHRVPEKVFHKATPPAASSSMNIEDSRLSTSTTPPNSPPAQRTSFTQPTVPVFSKPVFVPPVSTFTKSASPPTKFAFRPPPSPPKYNVPPSMALGFGSRLPSTSPKVAKVPAPLTAQSTLESIRSDKIFDTGHDDPAWMPTTQDTGYSTAFGSQSQPQTQDYDEDDSWPVDEKLAAGVQWTFGVSKEDSMTWSTLPSQSQRADTGPVTRTSPIREENSSAETEQSRQIPGGFDVEMEDDLGDGKLEDDLMSRDEELEEVVLGVRPVVEKEPSGPPRSQSQMSMASSESTQSQSQTGFLGQATKFLSSALGTGKKKQPEVKKVFSQAAVAAKKQQEEQDKKTTRMTNMEQRRQQALQRKAEEEKAKALQEEKRLKEEIERRKREREENTGKQPFKPTASKRQDDDTKKRKIEFSEKKPELKKPAPSMIIGKSHLKSAMKKSTTAYGNSSQAVASSSSMTIEATKPVAGSSSQLKMKASATATSHKMMTEDELAQPSQLMQSQMAARMKAQLEATKHAIPSESIELPDINSEYSDSDDEGRVAPDLPDWAQSPELRQALEMQSRINPADIFGPVPVLRMEEIFKNQRKGFRARTSSANWNGSDRLTTQEEESYARRMGFK
ncbi:hypothetical protein CPB83DRAFT_794894 [Crepidotus variabilis]|uniref:Inner centromere protein ARK-binding domain-containing protein n=1 Tax=Crepidotus variabilis TaxID=179855 RepID=A0A9P6EBQ8_9AGAR|nr:hypothetical protein CPB83DRAFT_794894 [Crepidotus variabilis]